MGFLRKGSSVQKKASSKGIQQWGWCAAEEWQCRIMNLMKWTQLDECQQSMWLAARAMSHSREPGQKQEKHSCPDNSQRWLSASGSFIKWYWNPQNGQGEENLLFGRHSGPCLWLSFLEIHPLCWSGANSQLATMRKRPKASHGCLPWCDWALTSLQTSVRTLTPVSLSPWWTSLCYN